MEYTTFSNFGQGYCELNSFETDPLSYCIPDDGNFYFNHGGNASNLRSKSKACNLYMAERCVNNWDGICQIMSKNDSVIVTGAPTTGERLLYETASKKYLIKMENGVQVTEQFDPNVESSPNITYWAATGGRLIPTYSVNPSTIDSDLVMTEMLQRPNVVMDILINIYNTMKREGTISLLKGTKLGYFYNTHPYFVSKGGL